MLANMPAFAWGIWETATSREASKPYSSDAPALGTVPQLRTATPATPVWRWWQDRRRGTLKICSVTLRRITAMHGLAPRCGE